MKIKSPNNIINDYRNQKITYELYAEKLKELIELFLKRNGVDAHSVTYRVKDIESLIKKVEKSEGKYKEITDITDVVGLRIITNFEDDVDKVASIIKNEFVIDEINSVDKRELLDHDRFGYLSLHYIIGLNEQRKLLTEYALFENISAEIQIRSILQHAWAEIEHDLGYKSSVSVPREVRRKFSRIAGLLEIADNEFVKIKEELSDYEAKVDRQVKESIYENMDIDKATLKAFIENSELVKEIDKEIAGDTGIYEELSESTIENNVPRLIYLGFNSIKDVKDKLEKNKRLIIEFSEIWLSRKDIDPNEDRTKFNKGISLFYLGYIVMAQTDDVKIVLNYLKNFSIGVKDQQEIAKDIIKYYNAICN